MGDYEKMVRIMASESRFHRRILSDAILDRADRAREGRVATMLPSEQPDVIYVLLIGQGAPRAEYPAYREHRSRELLLRCQAAKVVRPESRYIVGIGLDAMGVEGGAEDFAYLDTSEWGVDDLENARQMRVDLGYFIPGEMIEQRLQAEEYPEPIAGL